MPLARLHEKAPREQVGASTGPAFEYQYTQAAVDSLVLFEDALCVYCEWHDDYVIEHDSASSSSKRPVYRFHQVKTRGLTEGPWNLNRLFGVHTQKRVKNQPVPTTQPFQHMLEHALTFLDGCDRIVFVTNNYADEKVTDLLADIKAVQGVADLSTESKKWFDRILAVHLHVQPQLTADELFSVLRRFTIAHSRGNPSDGEMQLIALGVKITELSEVDLYTRQAVRIGRDILDLVRAKSGVKIEPLPPGFTDADLRAQKAIVVDDLLKLISLSPEGYRVLKSANDAAPLKALSRLQRFCKGNDIGPELIEAICEYKAAWDTWIISEKARVAGPELTALSSDCGALVTAYAALPSGSTKTVAWFVKEARTIAAQYSQRLKTVAPLRDYEVLGLIFKIAADRGAP